MNEVRVLFKSEIQARGAPGRTCTIYSEDPGLIPAQVICPVSLPSLSPCFLSVYCPIKQGKKDKMTTNNDCKLILQSLSMTKDSGTKSSESPCVLLKRLPTAPGRFPPCSSQRQLRNMNSFSYYHCHPNRLKESTRPTAVRL